MARVVQGVFVAERSGMHAPEYWDSITSFSFEPLFRLYAGQTDAQLMRRSVVV
jgi:hypothetical protein